LLSCCSTSRRCFSSSGQLGAQPLTGFLLFTFFVFAFLLVLILLYVYQARLLEAVTE
jgi:DMSO/TMAO reductase YedYZ heme-binding membrane subunit